MTPAQPRARCRLARGMAVIFVVLTAAFSLAWSHAKHLSQDEMFSLQTDSVASVSRLVHIQRYIPISLDPLLYHLLSHLGMDLFGAGPFALRLPSLIGFAGMQVCLFFFARNLIGGGSLGDRAGAIAAGFPALTAAFFYSAEGRPYGLLLGLYALALLCWQVAGRREQMRALPLAGLALAIGLAINTHYFGVLLLVPICTAEAFRTLKRRHIDWPMAVAIALGIAAFLGTVPFLKAAGEFRKDYYNVGAVGYHDVTRAYRSILIDYTQMTPSAQHVAIVLLVIFAAALVWISVRRLQAHTFSVPPAEWVAVLTLAALPFAGYLMAKYVTHAIEVRYVLGALIALTAMLVIAIAPALSRDRTFVAAIVALGVALVAINVARVRSDQARTDTLIASLVLAPQIKAALLRSPDPHLYLQALGPFEENVYYEPDPDVRQRMTLVYSHDEEMRWGHHSTNFLTAVHMKEFTDLSIVSYESLRTMPGQHIFVLYHSGWNWTDQALPQDGAKVTFLGKAIGQEDVAAVTF